MVTDERKTGQSMPFVGESLLDRARRRRAEALASRAGCVVRRTLDGGNVIEFKFHALPDLPQVLDRLGPDDAIVGTRFGEGEGAGKA